MDLAPFTRDEVERYASVGAGSALVAGIGLIAWAAFHGWEPFFIFFGAVAIVTGVLAWYFNR